MPELISASTDQEGFAPRQAVVNALRRWWMLALTVAAGGCIGLLASFLRPAQYEAGFTVTAIINQTISGELVEYSEDVQYESVGGLFYAPWLLERVAARAAQEGYPVDLTYLLEHTTVERRLSAWRMRVRHADPAVAEGLARIWQSVGEAELQSAYASAIRADALQLHLDSLESCLARAASSPPAGVQCASDALPALQQELKQTGKELAEARAGARGLSSSLVIGPAGFDLLPPRPVTAPRAQLALAGALIGLVAGAWGVQLRFDGARLG